MATIFGTLYWTGHLPDDDDVELAAKPVFSGDYGEQWQYMATEPVIQSLCEAMRRTEAFAEVCDPNPERSRFGALTSNLTAGLGSFTLNGSQTISVKTASNSTSPSVATGGIE